MTASLRLAFVFLQLMNPGNWCYLNTALLTTLWSILSCSGFQISHWGPLGHCIAKFLLEAKTTPVNVFSCEWMSSVLSQWPRSDVQGDPVEFLSFLIRGLCLPGFEWQWERRVQIGLHFSVRDQSASCSPLVMYIDPEQAHADKISLQQLIQTWHEYMGMHTALTGNPRIVCIHVDRTIILGNGETCKSDTLVDLHGDCVLPFFEDADGTIGWVAFKVVAAIAHLGRDQAGHCRAVLRVDIDPDARHPAPFLLTDDNTPPTWSPEIPSWIAGNLMCIWLCSRSHLYQPTALHCTPTAPASSLCIRPVDPAKTLLFFS